MEKTSNNAELSNSPINNVEENNVNNIENVAEANNTNPPEEYTETIDEIKSIYCNFKALATEYQNLLIENIENQNVDDDKVRRKIRANIFLLRITIRDVQNDQLEIENIINSKKEKYKDLNRQLQELSVTSYVLDEDISKQRAIIEEYKMNYNENGVNSLDLIEEKKREAIKLQQQCDVLLNEKEQILSALRDIDEKLNSQDNLIQGIFDLGIMLDKKIKLNTNEGAANCVKDPKTLLPPPLLSIYSLFVDNNIVDENKIVISINGDILKAKDLLDRNTTTIDDLTKMNQKDRENAIQPHPLNLNVQFISKITDDIEMCGKLSITFRYFELLKVVTVSSKVFINETQNQSDNMLSNILDYIICEDLGVYMHDPTMKEDLNKLNLTELICAQYCSSNNFGKAYAWAQKMCDLSYMHLLSDAKEINLLTTGLAIIEKIKTQWDLSLIQFHDTQFMHSTKMKLLYKSKLLEVCISSELISFNQITSEKYKSTLPNIETNSTDTFYLAEILNDTWVSGCIIKIPAAYPNEIPKWSILLEWKGVDLTPATNEQLREIEFWTNSLATDIHPRKSILLQQLGRTMVSLDVFSETSGNFFNIHKFSEDPSFQQIFSKVVNSSSYVLVKNEEAVVVDTIY